MAESASAPSASASEEVRRWRTAFLSLRDETVTAADDNSNSDDGDNNDIAQLLHHLLFSHSEILISAAPDLPSHEVTSDLVFLLELVVLVCAQNDEIENKSNSRSLFTVLSRFVHDVCHRVPLQLNSCSWSLLLRCLGNMLDILIPTTSTSATASHSCIECLSTLKCVVSGYQRKSSPSDDIQLVEFLLQVISRAHSHLSLWEIQTICLTLLSQTISRLGSQHFPSQLWISTVEVFRKVMDVLASNSILLQDNVMTRFYAALLHSLHLLLKDPKASLSHHVSSFVAALRMFFTYGIVATTYRQLSLKNDFDSPLEQQPKPTKHAPYRPPHLRNKNRTSWTDHHESSALDCASSDSDYSDSDGPMKDTDSLCKSRIRVAAIECIQDLCQADPKSLTTHWMLLLPTSDVLQPRRFEATLMTCLLFDPYLKARITSASTLAVMLDGPSSVFLQVAEYKEPSKCGSFTALSISLGHILMQLHTGFHEAEMKSGVLCSLFQYSEQVSNSAVCFEALQALRAVSHNYPSVMFSCWERVSTMVHGFLSVPTAEVNTKPWKGNVGTTVGLIGENVVTAAIKVLDVCLRAISGFKGTEDLFDDKLLETPFTSDYIRMKKVSSAPLYEPEISDDTKDEKVGESGIEQWSEALEKHMPLILRHTSAMVRAASVTCFAGITSSVFFSLEKEKQELILSSLFYAAKCDEVPSVRSAACRAIGVISCFPQVFQSAEILAKFVYAVEINTRDSSVSVRITASWALANICDSVRYCIDTISSEGSPDYKRMSQSVALLADCALRLSNDGDKIKSNAVRALGNLSRFIRCTRLSGFQDKIMAETILYVKSNSPEEFPSTSDWKGSNSSASTSCCPAFFVDPRWLERTVQAFISCVTTGNVKVQWNVCHALSKLFLNETLRLQEMDWAPSVFGILLLLLRDSSNFKIRIQAAAALAVPSSLLDYGNSFSDVVQGLVHLVENLDKDQISAPSSFKYRIALEKQVKNLNGLHMSRYAMTSTLLHALSLSSSTHHEPLKDFFIKKALFLEQWLRLLCSSFLASSSEPLVVNESVRDQKREMIRKAIWSLTELFEGRRQYAIAKKFDKLEENIQ
ncbi:hypothetical protein L484_011828 [Morus notabilis]|uniref:DUF4042 domain-containing protein n=1 Tax=Morus notabilis TaxID=981085 RepID=W9S6C1_9ROSA|nr:hypothetical protein L484_011828 [Morus notabilis]